jgi:hypothetical protein
MFAMMAGAGLGMATVNITIVRPLVRQCDAMQQEMASLGARMDRLSAARGGVDESNDLLSALEAQRETTAGARASLTAIRQLRAEVDQESRRTTAALENFAGLVALQARVLDAGSRTQALQAALNDVEMLGDRAALLGAEARDRVAAVQQADEALARLGALKSRVLKDAARLEDAHEALDSSEQLHASLAAAQPAADAATKHAAAMIDLAGRLGGVADEQLTASSQHAAELLALHDALVNEESLQFDDARHNLRMMLETQSRLARSSTDTVAAAENLEFLTEFRRQLSLELDSIEQLRRQLAEIAFLGDAVKQVSEMMAPLTELSTLRRLNDDEIRSMARQILDRRTASAAEQSTVESIFELPETTAEGPMEKPVPAPMQE